MLQLGWDEKHLQDDVVHHVLRTIPDSIPVTLSSCATMVFAYVLQPW